MKSPVSSSSLIKRVHYAFLQNIESKSQPRQPDGTQLLRTVFFWLFERDWPHVKGILQISDEGRFRPFAIRMGPHQRLPPGRREREPRNSLQGGAGPVAVGAGAGVGVGVSGAQWRQNGGQTRRSSPSPSRSRSRSRSRDRSRSQSYSRSRSRTRSRSRSLQRRSRSRSATPRGRTRSPRHTQGHGGRGGRHGGRSASRSRSRSGGGGGGGGGIKIRGPDVKPAWDSSNMVDPLGWEALNDHVRLPFPLAPPPAEPMGVSGAPVALVVHQIPAIWDLAEVFFALSEHVHVEGLVFKAPPKQGRREALCWARPGGAQRLAALGEIKLPNQSPLKVNW